MTRPASFNNTWAENVDPSQYADESTDTTLGFMRTGWEGGSDKKAPSAKTQNYHMRKHDLAMQEAERQGMLSWRNDVPYPAGARTWWHGNVFIAKSDNTNIEPQGGNDNGVWFLVPVGNYPTSWSSISDKPDTATRWPKYDEISNSPIFGQAAWQGVCNTNAENIPYDTYGLTTASTVAGVRDYLQKKVDDVNSSLKTIAKTGDINDTTNSLPWVRVSGKPEFKASAFKDFFDTGDVWTIPYGSTSGASTGCVAATRDFANDIKLSLKKVATTGDITDTTNSLPWERVSGRPDLGDAALRGVCDTLNPSSIPLDGNLVTTASTVAAVRDMFVNYINGTRSFGEVYSIAMCIKITGGDLHVKPGEIVLGESIVPCTTGGNVEPGYGALEGRWMSCGVSWGVGSSHNTEKTNIYLRIS